MKENVQIVFDPSKESSLELNWYVFSISVPVTRIWRMQILKETQREVETTYFHFRFCMEILLQNSGLMGTWV
jgi:hypothetical protein